MSNMKNLVVITGAGISAESGLSTFRDADGLWENYPVMDVASHEGFLRNPQLIHKFYSEMREKLPAVQPSGAHKMIADLESSYNVTVVTQNVDDLHERAGSTCVVHLHGELMKVRSMRRDDRVYTLPCSELSDHGLRTTVDTVDAFGDHVRPHIVFFGESVPEFEPALELVQKADVVVVIGTSLVVYPAAALLNYAPADTEVYYIDPKPNAVPARVHVVASKATDGLAEIMPQLIASR